MNLMATKTSKEWAFVLVLLVVGTGLIFYLVPRTSKGAHINLFGLAILTWPFLVLVLSMISVCVEPAIRVQPGRAVRWT